MKECKKHDWYVRKWYEKVESDLTIKVAKEVACYECGQWKEVNLTY